MKLFVISDTHGNIEKAKEIYGKLSGIDFIVHLGDLVSDATRLSQELNANVISVEGNVDGSYSSDDYRILDTEYGSILLVHGHMQHVKRDLQPLVYMALELGCKAALFGHTHIPLFEYASGIYLVNPGSLTRPIGGTSGSYAIVHTSETEFSASIVYYSDVILSGNKKPAGKISGGYLKNLLNNSDRF